MDDEVVADSPSSTSSTPRRTEEISEPREARYLAYLEVGGVVWSDMDSAVHRVVASF